MTVMGKTSVYYKGLDYKRLGHEVMIMYNYAVLGINNYNGMQ